MNKKTSAAIIIILCLILGVTIYGNFFNKPEVQKTEKSAATEPADVDGNQEPMQSSKAQPFTLSEDGKTLSLKLPSSEKNRIDALSDAEKSHTVELFLAALNTEDVTTLIARRAVQIADRFSVGQAEASRRGMQDGQVQAKLFSILKPELSQAPTFWDDSTIIAFCGAMTEQVADLAFPSDEISQEAKMKVARLVNKVRASAPDQLGKLDDMTVLEAINIVIVALRNPDALEAAQKRFQASTADRPGTSLEKKKQMLIDVLQSDSFIDKEILPQAKVRLSQPPYGCNDAQIRKFIKICSALPIEEG